MVEAKLYGEVQRSFSIEKVLRVYLPLFIAMPILFAQFVLISSRGDSFKQLSNGFFFNRQLL